MAEEIILEATSIIKKSNILARASWSPDSVWESRIVAIIAAQVHKDDKDFLNYRIPIQELLAVSGKTNTGRVYEDLDRLTDKAMTRLVKLKEGKRWIKYTLFSRCEYTEGTGNLLVQFHPDLKPHYLELQKHFTIYSLAEFLSLPSTYSQRIYEILRSWDDCVVTEINIDDLHEMLCTPVSMHKNFNEFKRRALDKAHKDITEKTQLKYEWEYIKKGRKVVKIRFVMGKKSVEEIQKKKRNADRKEQSVKNNALFLAAVQCAAKHPDDCGTLRDTHDYCQTCMNIQTKGEKLMPNISARIDEQTAKKLAILAKDTSRSKSFLVSEAVQAYVENQVWQIEAIKEGINQADSDNFASDVEVKQAFAKWGVNAG